VKTTADFLDRLTDGEGLRVLDLLDRAFGDDIYSSNTRSAFFGGYQSESPNVVLLHVDRDLAGVAVVGTRTIHLAGAQVSALTVGPLAIDPRFQKRGLSSLLMSGIDDLASALGAPVAYLQGTPGFYHRFGYYPLLARTKVSLNTDAIETLGGVKVRPFSDRYLPEMINLFEVNSRMYSCASTRSEQDWDWLTRYACDTYYFYRPKVVTADDQFVGYFCGDSRESGRIREAVHGTGSEEIGLFLSGLKAFSSGGRTGALEIMTPAGSPLHEYLRRGMDATFTESMQSNGGQLMKVFDVEQLLSKVHAAGAMSCIRDSESKLPALAPLSSMRPGDAGLPVSIGEHLPGVLSGYLPPGGMPTEAVGTGPTIGRARTQTPFIYQGDNY
jgi:predicted N-acetyltransferase YhbS